MIVDGTFHQSDVVPMTEELKRLMHCVIQINNGSILLVIFCSDNADRKWMEEFAGVDGRLKVDLEQWITRTFGVANVVTIVQSGNSVGIPREYEEFKKAKFPNLLCS